MNSEFADSVKVLVMIKEQAKKWVGELKKRTGVTRKRNKLEMGINAYNRVTRLVFSK